MRPAVILPLAVIVLLVAVLTAAATAVRSVSRIWLRHWAEQQLSGSLSAGTYLARPQRLLISAAAGITLLAVFAGAIVGAEPVRNGWPVVIAVAVLTGALLLFGQLLPRAIARRWAARLIPGLLPPLQGMALVLSPLVRAAQALARIARPRAARAPVTSREGIADLLREGELEGLGEPEEIEIITGVVQLGEKVLRDVMTPRTDVFAVDVDLPAPEMANAIAQAGYSRVPVYRGSLDEIVGMVHVFDVLRERGERWPPIRPVMQAPGSKRCSEMLFEMLRRQQQFAVVLDEFGGTAGIVTLEDVLEELVGEIRDEHDEPELARAVPAPRALVLEASAPLEEVAARFGIALPAELSDRAQSLGGAIVRLAGRIPVTGERFRLAGLDLTVVEAEPSRLRRVLVQRAEGAAPVELALPR